MNKNILFAGLVNALNIVFIIGQLVNSTAGFSFRNSEFYIYLAIVVYYMFLFVNEIKIKYAPYVSPTFNTVTGGEESSNNKGSLERFMMDSYFKFCFALQGSAFFKWLTTLFKNDFKLNGSGFNEMSIFYSSIVIYVVMIASLYLFYEHKLIVDSVMKDFYIILVLNFSLFVLTFLIQAIDDRDLLKFFPRLADYAIFLVCSINSWQFYNFLLSKKLGVKKQSQQSQQSAPNPNSSYSQIQQPTQISSSYSQI